MMESSKNWCLVLFSSTVLLYASRVALPMSASIVGSQYQWSKTDSGVALSCFFWGYVCMQAIAGHLADTYGGENLLPVACLFWSLITLLTPFIFEMAYLTPYPMAVIVASRVALGIAQGFHFPTVASLIAKKMPLVDRARLFGLVMAGSHAGTVICGSAGSIILEKVGWEPLFVIIGVCGLLWWAHFTYVFQPALKAQILCLHIDEDKFVNKNGTSVNFNAKLLDAEAGGPVVKRPSEHVMPLPWMKLLTSSAFWAAFCAHFCGANAYFTLFSWLPSYFSENFTTAKGWVFNFVPNLAVMITSLIAPAIASKLTESGYSTTFVRKLMEGISQVGIAICLAMVSLSNNSYGSALFFLSAAMALRGFHHGGVAVNPQDFAPNHAGTVFGLMNMASGIPGFVGVYAAGYILDVYHSWAYVFNCTSVVCIFGVLVYCVFGTSKQII